MLENNIGPHYAPFYDIYAAALSEKGRVEEAVKLVEQAMAQNAQPMKKLQLRLEALKQPQTQSTSSTSSTSAASSKTTSNVPQSTGQDEQVRMLQQHISFPFTYLSLSFFFL